MDVETVKEHANWMLENPANRLLLQHMKVGEDINSSERVEFASQEDKELFVEALQRKHTDLIIMKGVKGGDTGSGVVVIVDGS